jgi:protein-S-isoprenylcysteine O-methyltransferase Ste14
MTRTEECTEQPREPWHRGKRGEWYVIAQVGFFALVAIGPRTVPGWPAWQQPWATVATWLGLTLMLAGAALSFGGVFRLGPNLTPLPYPKDCSELVESGPYSIVRHPIYSGAILGSVGWGLWVHGLLTILWASLLLLFFDVKSRKEEVWLSEKFAGYATYRARVRKLIPWVY